MTIAPNGKISAASAIAHTRKPYPNTSFQLPSGFIKKALVLSLVMFLSYTYRAIQPPPTKICGTQDGPKITAPRIKLSDGRHLAYKEGGVSKGNAKYKIVYVHGFASCRHDTFAKLLSPEVVEELGIYVVSFDRPGYGESDPNPKRTVKSMALDIEELADQLELGSKFYLIGFSMGGQVLWSCLKYIPHRLAGTALLAPVVNYWWSGFPSNISSEGYKKQFWNDKWAVGVAHYAPWLTYWWNTQKWFPSSSVVAYNPNIFSTQDKKLLVSPPWQSRAAYQGYITQQGVFESLFRDMIVGFGSWEFSPLEMENPFPKNEGSAHLWHGDDDLLVPVSMQRYIAQKLPWINYHELPGSGHLFPDAKGMGKTIIKELLVGKK